MTKPTNPYAEAYAGFLRQTAEHELVVLRDNGVYRHLRLRKPGTRIWSWDVVTWPGHLVTCGDIADGYMFARKHDMIEFFHLPSGRCDTYSDGAPRLGFRYWAEKLCGDRSAEIKEYAPDVFLQHVHDTLHEHQTLSEEAIAEIRQDDPAEADRVVQRRELLLDNAKLHAETEHEAREWLQQSEQLDVFGEDAGWEWDLKDYDIHFRYACYCIDLAVRLYHETEVRAQVSTVVKLARKVIPRKLKAVDLGRRWKERVAVRKVRSAAARVGIKLLPSPRRPPPKSQE
ncbi:hypothetical protein L3Q67_26680 [Saccharothrix sp. AJ9571]|nr:hypothetical protein L3Q67_26680 [Saccharothrix sp. AJ9571]